MVDLTGTAVTAKAVDELRHSLKDCQILNEGRASGGSILDFLFDWLFGF
jgi:hypothetical protein